MAILDKPRHIRYWLRNLKTLLPHHYTGNESNRMYLGFFIISALDLLDAYIPNTTAAERQDHVNWIYHCQHPDGGFRMWPGTDFGTRANPENSIWDPANLPATYFALATLLVVGDDFSRVNRKETLDWLRRMQRADGSFGETYVDGHIEGGRDPRFSYCAMGARYILRGQMSTETPGRGDLDSDDVNIDGLVECISKAIAYEGGIADEIFHEPHAGYTFCALGAVDLAGRLGRSRLHDISQGPDLLQDRYGSLSLDPTRVLHWLVHEQTDWIDPDSDDPNEEINVISQPPSPPALPGYTLAPGGSEPLHQAPATSTFTPNTSSQSLPPVCAAGFCGRPNKPADTCYAWWVCGALHLLPSGSGLYNRDALECYLLEKTQHPVLGGFSKFPGEPPDLYHSYLGLAAYGLCESESVKLVDGGMCISVEARQRIGTLWQ